MNHVETNSDDAIGPTRKTSHARRRWLGRAAAGILGLLLVGPLAAGMAASASTSDPWTIAPISPASVTSTLSYQESSARIDYVGRWAPADLAAYSGGHVQYAKTAGASATLSFTGASVAWVGPIGPTRGSAKVYVDGRYMKAVSSYANTFSPSRMLFRQSFTTSATHKLKIVVQGTTGHPVVAIDRFIVSSDPEKVVTSAPSVTTATSGKTVTVGSISSLLTALDNDTVDVIVVRNGTYHVSPSNGSASDSLWIGARFADRTRPVTVRAETRGGVTFDGGGASGYGGLSFEDGAHHQTWDGFRFANMTADQSGIVEFGGYTPRRAPHHIAIQNITVLGSCRGTATTQSGNSTEHAVYFAHAAGTGPHDLVVESLSVDGSGYLASAIHGDHGDAANPPSTNVIIRGLTVTGTQNAIILWHPSYRSWRIEGATIKNVLANAIRFESIGASSIVFKGIVSTGSGQGGFYSSLGESPPGVTFSGNSLH